MSRDVFVPPHVTTGGGSIGLDGGLTHGSLKRTRQETAKLKNIRMSQASQN